MEFRQRYAIVQAYQAHTRREIRGNDEFLTGRAKRAETLVSLQNKMTEIQEKIDKELKSKYPDLTRVDRMYKILKNIQRTLENAKER